MAYSVYLTRKATSWADPHDPATITLAEWNAYVLSDPELAYAEFTRSNRESQPDDPELAATCVWARPAWQARQAEATIFRFEQGRISVVDPDALALEKLVLMAQVLRARVQGDDGTYYDEGDPLEEALYGSQGLGAPAWDAPRFHEFQIYPSLEAAQPLLLALARAQIPYQLEQHAGEQTLTSLDASFGTYQSLPKTAVRLPPAEFARARALLSELYHDALTQLAPDHYLRSFTDEELFAILARPGDWSALDVALAEQLLRQRGHDTSPGARPLRRS